MKTQRIAIVESSVIIAEGLASILGEGGDSDVVFVCQDLKRLIERFAVVAPDVVVINAQSALASAQPLRTLYPELQQVALVALLSSVCDEEAMRQFDGVINIYDSAQQIQRKLLSAIDQSQTNPYSESHDLSDRELDVLILVARGMSNKEIADELNISIHTVMSHRKNITHKTGIKSVAGLTVFALLNNLLDQSDVTL